MVSLPPSVATLIAALSKLPGIGPRSAERVALHLVQRDSEEVHALAQALTHAKSAIRFCSRCGALTESDPCRICSDAKRDPAFICVVERATDIFNFEKSGIFHGLYHVLGGKLSPLNGVEPEDLRIAELEKRIPQDSVREVVIALSTDVEGDATAHYLARRLQGKGATVSRIAHGLPAGSGLEFTDEVTLGRALEGRREILG